jgi:hypothetical protein
MKDGLDAPDVPLLRELRAAVDHAYPPQAASQPSGPPSAQPGNQPSNQTTTPTAPQKKP